MNLKQVVNFNLRNMGTRIGYCLQNVRLAFGLPARYPSAKADMEANKAAGTLHDISTLPNNVAVPVYLDTSSPYEHIIVSDHGTFYSDGKRLTSLNGFKVFGWGEMCEGVRVVERIEEQTPTKKSNEEIADEVIAGKWGNGDERKNRLTAAGYDYGAIQSIVNARMGGSTPSSTIDYCVRKGDTLSAIAMRYGTTVAKIAADNGIANPNLIYAGQRLVINL